MPGLNSSEAWSVCESCIWMERKSPNLASPDCKRRFPGPPFTAERLTSSRVSQNATPGFLRSGVTKQGSSASTTEFEGIMNAKKKAVLDRIKHLEDAITKGREYLENGDHADWRGFRPLFAAKMVGDKKLPPHQDGGRV